MLDIGFCLCLPFKRLKSSYLMCRKESLFIFVFASFCLKIFHILYVFVFKIITANLGMRDMIQLSSSLRFKDKDQILD